MNNPLLKMGLEQEGLQYMRIGLPFFDLDEIFTNTDKSKEIVSKIMDWVIWEYHAVKKLIK